MSIETKNTISTKLTDTDLDIAAYVEQYFWKNGQKLPSLDLVAKALELPYDKVEKSWNKDIVQNVLKNRGVLYVEKAAPGFLSHKQVAIINAVLSVEDQSSFRQKLKTIGITPAQYYSWCKDPVFQDYMKIKAESLYGIRDTQVVHALTERALDGDVNAIKLYLEVKGIYNPRIQLEVNVESVFMQIVEVIAKHLHAQPELMSAVAEDLENVIAKARAIPAKAIEVA